ncbi:hypothetical protein ABTI05_19280, partial [Acinetobacter baumannii]
MLNPAMLVPRTIAIGVIAITRIIAVVAIIDHVIIARIAMVVILTVAIPIMIRGNRRTDCQARNARDHRRAAIAIMAIAATP